MICLAKILGIRLCRRSLFATAFLLLLWPLLGGTVLADDLTFSYTDPVGDSTGAIDVISMVVVFDNTTGNYKITLTATGAQPFVGDFRININLFNPAWLPDNSFFQDVVNDYNLLTPVTKIVLKGFNPNLFFWVSGDTVATNTAASGGLNPPGSSHYRCQVTEPPWGLPLEEDNIAYDWSGVATITPLTPQGAVTGLQDGVQVLKETGIISADQASGLFDKLSAALRSLNQGNMKAARNQIAAFVNQVHAFILAGILTWEQGQDLIDEALKARGMCI